MRRAMLRDRSGAAGAEFALLLPLVVLFLFGIIDVGRWLWSYNLAQKATQMGAREAVVTNPVSSAVNLDYVGLCNPPLTQGDAIPADCTSTITCTVASCSSGALQADAFEEIVHKMQYFLPDLTDQNVTIQYSPSGLGYAGNPNGSDVSPIVTVKIGDTASGASAFQFVPITFLLLSAINMPPFTTSLTAEDLVGAQSN